MKRMRISAIIFGVMLTAILFNYIYVCSVRNDMLRQTDMLCRSFEETISPDTLEQAWKNRKGLLSLSVPLAVLDQIDIQLSIMKACALTQDSDAYLRACHHLQELLASLSG